MTKTYTSEQIIADCRREFDSWPQWLKDYYAWREASAAKRKQSLENRKQLKDRHGE
jgi:hypothetical protein